MPMSFTVELWFGKQQGVLLSDPSLGVLPTDFDIVENEGDGRELLHSIRRLKRLTLGYSGDRPQHTRATHEFLATQQQKGTLNLQIILYRKYQWGEGRSNYERVSLLKLKEAEVLMFVPTEDGYMAHLGLTSAGQETDVVQ